MSKGTASMIPGWYVEFQANVLRQLPRPSELDSVTAEGWSNNQSALKKVLAGVLLPNPEKLVSDDWFRQLNSFTITVPADYDHGTQLARFAKENRDKFYYYNEAVTDNNFNRVTNRLIPGKTYEGGSFFILRQT